MRGAGPVKTDLSGRRFGKLVVVGLSDKRGSRGKRTVPLWECLCDCGGTVYKATDTLNGEGTRMCGECARKYASERMRQRAGYVDGTQVTRLKSERLSVTNTSGCRGVCYDKKTGLWRARLKFKGQQMSFGSYKTFEAAVKARKAAEIEYYGEYLKEE